MQACQVCLHWCRQDAQDEADTKWLPDGNRWLELQTSLRHTVVTLLPAQNDSHCGQIPASQSFTLGGLICTANTTLMAAVAVLLPAHACIWSAPLVDSLSWRAEALQSVV